MDEFSLVTFKEDEITQLLEETLNLFQLPSLTFVTTKLTPIERSTLAHELATFVSKARLNAIQSTLKATQTQNQDLYPLTSKNN